MTPDPHDVPGFSPEEQQLRRTMQLLDEARLDPQQLDKIRAALAAIHHTRLATRMHLERLQMDLSTVVHLLSAAALGEGNGHAGARAHIAEDFRAADRYVLSARELLDRLQDDLAFYDLL